MPMENDRFTPAAVNTFIDLAQAYVWADPGDRGAIALGIQELLPAVRPQRVPVHGSHMAKLQALVHDAEGALAGESRSMIAMRESLAAVTLARGLQRLEDRLGYHDVEDRGPWHG